MKVKHKNVHLKIYFFTNLAQYETLKLYSKICLSVTLQIRMLKLPYQGEKTYFPVDI